MQRRIDLNAPAPPDTIRVQLALHGALAEAVKALMTRYDLEQAAAVRMLLIDGLEARRGRVA